MTRLCYELGAYCRIEPEAGPSRDVADVWEHFDELGRESLREALDRGEFAGDAATLAWELVEKLRTFPR